MYYYTVSAQPVMFPQHIHQKQDDTEDEEQHNYDHGHDNDHGEQDEEEDDQLDNWYLIREPRKFI